MASGACSLENSPLNLVGLREKCEAQLCEALDSIEGAKILVLDEELIGPLGTVVGIQKLKEHGVTNIFPLEANLFRREPAQEAGCCIYIARPRLKSTQIFANHMRENDDKLFSLFFVPRRSITCEQVLEAEGLLDRLAQPVSEIKLDLVPYDSDVLSLELGTSFRDLYLDQDRSELFYVAEAMMRLQEMYGAIPTIRTKGTCAQLVKDMMVRMRRERGLSSSDSPGEIDTVIILDRDSDLVTPMLTQITYEGLVDEHLGISNASVMLDAKMVGNDKAPPGKKVKHPLNSDDTLYADIRDLNFSVLSRILGEKARTLKESEDERHQAHSVGQIKDFVKKLGSLQSEKQSLTVHIEVSQAIQKECGDEFARHFQTEQDIIRGDDLRACVDYLDNAIIDKKPLAQVLRQLCLLSLTTNELKQRKWEEIRHSMIQSYGYPVLFTLLNLEKVGLLQQSGAKGSVCKPGNWGRVKGQCQLFFDTEVESPADISYIFSGYAPLSCRLVQMAHSTGPFDSAAGGRPQDWGALDGDLPGGPSDEAQQLAAPAGGGVGAAEAGRQKKLTLVLFLGGVTFAEISALRFMGQKDPARQYVVATTKLVNGGGLIHGLTEDSQGLAPDRSSWVGPDRSSSEGGRYA